MKRFFVAYCGGKEFENPDEGAVHLDKWRDWFAKLGDAVENSGSPLGNSKSISSDGVAEGEGANRIAGYSILRAASIDDAIEMTKSCPHLEFGFVQVAELVEI